MTVPIPKKTVVGLPLIFSDAGQKKIRIAVHNGSGLEHRDVTISNDVARAVLGLEVSSSKSREQQAYDTLVAETMELVKATEGEAQKKALKKLEGLLSDPKHKVRSWKHLGITQKLEVATDWQRSAEKMRARLERVREVVQGALQKATNVPDEEILNALEGSLSEIQETQFVAGASALIQRGTGTDTVEIVGELVERVPGRVEDIPSETAYREEPRALTTHILKTISSLKASVEERSSSKHSKKLLERLNEIETNLKSAKQPDRVWADYQSREFLFFMDQALTELDEDNGLLVRQNVNIKEIPEERETRNIWFAYWWADQLHETAQNKKDAISGDLAGAMEKAKALAEGKKGREASTRHLTQSKEIQLHGGKGKPIGEAAQHIMKQSRGSYVVQQKRSGAAKPDMLVVSHRYDPDRTGLPMGTMPSLAGKQAPVLTSARTVEDVGSGQRLTAHGRLNTVDRLLEAQTFVLSELYEDPALAEQINAVFIHGIEEKDRDDWEMRLRNIQLPTGLEWEERENGCLKWVKNATSGRWKPQMALNFLDLNMLTPGLGGKDTGDQPEWAPATALWRRGEKGKAVALVAGRLLGLPYLAEKLMAQFLAEQRWSEQEASGTHLLRGEEFELLGIPVRLNTLMISRAMNIFAEGEPLHRLSKNRARELSADSEKILKARLDKETGRLTQEDREWESFFKRSDEEIKKEYLELITAPTVAQRRRRDRLFEYLTKSPEEIQAKRTELQRDKARLEGLWKVAFDYDYKTTPEARMLALVELAKGLNVRIGAHCKSGKDRTGNLVAIFGATRQWFREHPQPPTITDSKWTNGDEWARYFSEIPKQPLFQASFANYDEILSQQQADMMQQNRKLDRAPFSGRMAGVDKLHAGSRPYHWVTLPPSLPPAS